MKTATLTAKVNRWLHEHLAMKTPAKLLGGLALSALVMTATALPLGTTYADEPARPLSSEQGACYPLYPELGPCWSEFIAVAPTIVDRYDRSLDDEFMSDAPFFHTLNQGKVGSPASTVQFEEWPEAGFDSYTYHRFMVEQGKLEQAKASNRLYSEQNELDFIEELEIMGIPWRFDDRGRVVMVEEPRESVAATVIDRYDRSLDDEFMSDAPFFHTLNQGKVGSPASIARTECYAEIDQSACTSDQLKASLGLVSSSIDQRFPPGTLPED
jgi:hypothetical protein